MKKWALDSDEEEVLIEINSEGETMEIENI